MTTSVENAPFTPEQLQWLRENLVIDVAPTYGSTNSTWLRLSFKEDKYPFCEGHIYIPSDSE